jgi:hypothetical protein
MGQHFRNLFQLNGWLIYYDATAEVAVNVLQAEQYTILLIETSSTGFSGMRQGYTTPVRYRLGHEGR